jgi:hypothetical protein
VTVATAAQQVVVGLQVRVVARQAPAVEDAEAVAVVAAEVRNYFFIILEGQSLTKIFRKTQDSNLELH